MARLRAGQNDADEFAAINQKLNKGEWPWPIVAMFQGAVSPDEAISSASAAPDQKTRDSQLCEADFYVGVFDASKQDKAAARRHLQSALDHCPPGYDESTAANYELKRLDDLVE
jgi:lipoprotein NlpI